MSLLLVQHGRSLPENLDPEKGLSEKGISDVEYIANAARAYGIKVSRIMHSGKKRARQTAEIFESALKPDFGVIETRGLNPLDDVSTFAGMIDGKEDLMLVGHLPFMEKLVSFLITGSTERPVIKFQNGGIVCLQKEPDSGHWIIEWTLLPEIGEE